MYIYVTGSINSAFFYKKLRLYKTLIYKKIRRFRKKLILQKSTKHIQGEIKKDNMGKILKFYSIINRILNITYDNIGDI